LTDDAFDELPFLDPWSSTPGRAQVVVAHAHVGDELVVLRAAPDAASVPFLGVYRDGNLREGVFLRDPDAVSLAAEMKWALAGPRPGRAEIAIHAPDALPEAVSYGAGGWLWTGQIPQGERAVTIIQTNPEAHFQVSL
jgi:hypothetical protein